MPSGSSSSCATGSAPRSGGGHAATRTGVAVSGAPWRDQVHQGLVGLGWSAKEAERAVDEVADQADGPTPDVGALLRAALQMLRKA